MTVALNGICKSFDGVKVLDGFSFAFPNNSITVVTGPSGSGKTTLLRIIAGLEKADGGELRIDGKKISMVFQEDRLLPSKTALENVAAVTDKENARHWLDRVGLADFACTLPRELSGGMKRRVAIARALAFGGDILLLDEPFMGLDPDLHDCIFDLISKEKEKSCIILVTHDMDDAVKCDFRVSI